MGKKIVFNKLLIVLLLNLQLSCGSVNNRNGSNQPKVVKPELAPLVLDSGKLQIITLFAYNAVYIAPFINECFKHEDEYYSASYVSWGEECMHNTIDKEERRILDSTEENPIFLAEYAPKQMEIKFNDLTTGDTLIDSNFAWRCIEFKGKFYKLRSGIRDLNFAADIFKKRSGTDTTRWLKGLIVTDIDTSTIKAYKDNDIEKALIDGLMRNKEDIIRYYNRRKRK